MSHNCNVRDRYRNSIKKTRLVGDHPILSIAKRSIFNILRPRQNGRHFADDILNSIFLNENVGIPIKISLKFVPKGPIDNIPSLVQIMAWHRPGDKPLSEPMMVRLPTHICVVRPQWVILKQLHALSCSIQDVTYRMILVKQNLENGFFTLNFTSFFPF